MKYYLKAYFQSKLFFVLILLFFAHSLSGQSNVPDWFLKPENFNSKKLAIGISNPNPDSLAAYKQAKMRALLNYSIIHHSKLQSLTTLSMGNQQNNPLQLDNLQYIIYTNIFSGELPLLDSLDIVKRYYNKYNKEAIVLIKIPENFRKDSLKLSYTLTRKAAFQREQNYFPVAVDEIDFKIVENDTVVENFHVERDGTKMKNKSQKSFNIFNDEWINKICYYGINGNILGDSPDNSMLPCPLYTGLWNSYIFNLVDQACILNQFDEDLRHKLSTSNLANSNNQTQNQSYQQLAYTLKNINTSEFKTSIQKIGIFDNQLFIGLKYDNENVNNPNSSLSRTDKKEIKKLQSENWKVYRQNDLAKAWLDAKGFIKDKNYIYSLIDVQVNNLQSGIIEAVNFAKLELSSQLGSKINTMNSNENSESIQSFVSSSKLSDIKKTGKISPQFIFYTRINESAYRVKVILFYKLI